ncbi:nickel-responsive transcriptional regulator NikR [Pontibaca methylaminivorans]|uniref:Putative nickel-responsive regulator n=1 Tax=Pontibaca methylaminivorans TaxID=515897 RepID=A0A1R3WYG4_9RHOB|nr:nickel-responsive transcriptional regulator NikR [Pontibaca methylaminivorans]SIT82797.1 transcriptional regulator, CopG family [Pontibaca methylaminivorans]
MQRVTVTLDDELMTVLDAVMRERGYRTRSEALRDLTRMGLARTRAADAPDADCVAVVIYTYNHHARELTQKVTSAHHSHHALQVSSLHVHLDPAMCMEVSILRGPVGEVRHFSDHLLSERHIRNGDVVIVPLPDIAAADD